MIIGASYGGVPSLTATAGPGLALMTEAIGLAVSCRGADRGGRRDARRAVHRHPGQERAERPVVRRQWPARRRAAAGAGTELHRRLPGHHPVGGAPGRGAAGAGDRVVGSVHGPVARHHRPPGRRRLRRRAPDCRAQHARLQALSRHRVGHLADGHSGHAGRGVHRRRPRTQRGRHSEQPVARPPAAARQARTQAGAVRLRPALGRHRRRRRRRGDHLRLGHRHRARGGCARRCAAAIRCA